MNESYAEIDSENAINVFLNLLFKRLNQELLDVKSLANDLNIQFQLLCKACKSSSSSEISSCKKKLINEFNLLLRYSCVIDPQSMHLHFIQELEKVVDKYKTQDNYSQCKICFANNHQNDSLNEISNENSFLYESAKASMHINQELLLKQTKIQNLRNKTNVYKKEMKFQQLNDFIKEDLFGKHSINNNIRSAIKVANDVQFVIDLMNKSVKDS